MGWKLAHSMPSGYDAYILACINWLALCGFHYAIKGCLLFERDCTLQHRELYKNQTRWKNISWEIKQMRERKGKRKNLAPVTGTDEKTRVSLI